MYTAASSSQTMNDICGPFRVKVDGPGPSLRPLNGNQTQWVARCHHPVGMNFGRRRSGASIATRGEKWECPRMNENEGRQAEVPEGETEDRAAKVPLTARLVLRESLTARRA